MSCRQEAGICPVCGQPNHCKMAANEQNTEIECWCFSMPEKINESVLAKLAKDNKKCVCRTCWEKAGGKS